MPRALPMVRPSAPTPSEPLAGGAESGASGEQPTCRRGKHPSWRQRSARGRRRGQDARAAPPGCAQALIEPELHSEPFSETANSCIRAAASLRGVAAPSIPPPTPTPYGAHSGPYGAHLAVGGDPRLGEGGLGHRMHQFENSAFRLGVGGGEGRGWGGTPRDFGE